LSLLWEIVLQGAGDLLVELGYASLRESTRERSRAHPVLAGFGVLLFGALAGAITRIVWPGRILDPGSFRGASLILSPLVNGIVMNRWGMA